MKCEFHIMGELIERDGQVYIVFDHVPKWFEHMACERFFDVMHRRQLRLARRARRKGAATIETEKAILEWKGRNG